VISGCKLNNETTPAADRRIWRQNQTSIRHARQGTNSARDAVGRLDALLLMGAITLLILARLVPSLPGRNERRSIGS